jgi:uncharacterized protein YutE (UPF0331/DUF86 family)
VHPTNYEDVIRRLGEQGVVSDELCRDLRGLGGFRNILVHGYLDIDAGRVYEFLTTRLGQLARCADEIEDYLMRRGPETGA